MNNETLKSLDDAMKCLVLYWYEKMADKVDDKFLNTVIKPMLNCKRELQNK